MWVRVVRREDVTIRVRLRLDTPSPTVQTHGRRKTRSELTLPVESPFAVIHDTSGVSSMGDVTGQPCPVITVGGLVSNACHYQIAPVRVAPPVSALERQSKPPYSIPTMADIAAVPPNGYKVASLFSGAGGSCLGFELAGYRVLWANEFIPAAADVYRLNHPDVILDTRDIRLISASELLTATGLAVGELDVLEGSPPCASFSTAGKRAESWGKVKTYSDTTQRADDLFFELIRLIDGVRPKTFVAENVSGLVKGVAKGYFKEILRAMRAIGYRVEAKLLDAQWLGVPQARQRIIFIGVRDDLDTAPAFPTPFAYRYSVRDALPWLSTVSGRTGAHFVRTLSELDRPMNAIIGSDPKQTRYEVETSLRYGNAAPYDAKGRALSVDEPLPSVLGLNQMHNGHQFALESRVIHTPGGENGTRFSPRDVTDSPAPTILAGGNRYAGRTDDFAVETDISRYAIAEEWDRLKPGESTFYGGPLTKPSLDKPCPTVTQVGGNTGASSVCHPTERRKFTITELKRVCAFPDDFVLTGTYAQQWERLGRAVPPLMMFAIAETLRREVLDLCP